MKSELKLNNKKRSEMHRRSVMLQALQLFVWVHTFLYQSFTNVFHDLIDFLSSSNLQDLSKGIKMIAGLLDDDDDGKNLLDATRGLASAFSNLLKAAQEGGGADSEVSILDFSRAASKIINNTMC